MNKQKLLQEEGINSLLVDFLTEYFKVFTEEEKPPVEVSEMVLSLKLGLHKIYSKKLENTNRVIQRDLEDLINEVRNDQAVQNKQ